jgi:hypothetical protein
MSDFNGLLVRLIEERDALRLERDELTRHLRIERAESAPILAAFDDWGVWQFVDTQSRDMCGMPIDKQMEHLAAERMRQLWIKRHPEFFRKAIECQPD